MKENTFIFQYHPDYLADSTLPAISCTFPKQPERYEFINQIPAFFDNLLAEGWLGKVQSVAIDSDERVIDEEKEDIKTRYHRMNMFGRDYPGAVWVTYIQNDPNIMEELYQETVKSALQSRSSISGVQPKLLGMMKDEILCPADCWETSNYIIKLPSDKMPGLIEYEYMSMIATKALLPEDKTADALLTNLHLADGNIRQVLAIKRFDRTEEGGKIHFEEINQIMGNQSKDKYEGTYYQIIECIKKKMNKEEAHDTIKLFYSRLISQFLLGNTDSHLKNFALSCENGKVSFTPNYDLAPTVNFHKGEVALGMHGERRFDAIHSQKRIFNPQVVHYKFKDIDARILVTLGREFGMSNLEIKESIDKLKSNIEQAKSAVFSDPSTMLDVTVGKFKSDNPNSHRDSTYREDFCNRIDGRCIRLLGGVDAYIKKLEAKKSGIQR